MKFWGRFFENPDELCLEEKLFINVVKISFIAGVVFLLNSIVIIKDNTITSINLVCTILLYVLYLLVRKPGRHKKLLIPYGLFLLAAINLSWFTTGGYNGPNGYILLTTFLILVIVAPLKIRPWIIVVFLLDILLLFALEYFYPDLASHLPPKNEMIGQAIVILMCTIVIGYMILLIKNNYDNEKVRSKNINKALVGKHEEVAKQNNELLLREEKLEAQRMLLEQKNQKILEQNMALQNHSLKLEQQVGERTAQLETLNKDLLDQNLKLEHFTFILAHNLKSPVAQLIGLTDLLKRTVPLEDLTGETVNKISNSADNLMSIIKDLNQILHIRRGNDAFFEEVDLSDILRKVLYTLENDILSKQAEIKISEDKAIEIRGVRAYFQSIFYNLINNALKYSVSDRVPVIKIEIKRVKKDLIISVHDNGIGIDMKMAGDKLFQLYQRFHTGYQGKGFGLFLTKTQVEVMGGKIEVASQPDKGTHFKIVFSKNESSFNNN